MDQRTDTTVDLPTGRTRSWVRRGVRLVLWVAAALMTLVVFLYAFGGMWVRTPAMKAAYDERVTANRAPVLEPVFVVPVPGCVCHSDDAVVQAEHSRFRIRECGHCHA